MASDFRPDEMQSLWRDQPLDSERIAVEMVRQLAGGFQARIRRRNLIEYIGGALGIAGHLVIAIWTRNAWVRTGSIMVVAGALYICYQLHRRAAAIFPPEDLALRPGIRFHRSQLERQRDALRGVWSWYIFPMLPGLLLVLAAGARGALHAVINVTVLAALAAGVIWLNHRAANRLQSQIDRLDSMEKGDSQ